MPRRLIAVTWSKLSAWNLARADVHPCRNVRDRPLPDRLLEVLGERHRWHAVRGHLHELSGDFPAAATAYADARDAVDSGRRPRGRDGVLRRARTQAAGPGTGPGQLGNRVVGLEGVRAEIAMLGTRDADGSS